MPSILEAALIKYREILIIIIIIIIIIITLVPVRHISLNRAECLRALISVGRCYSHLLRDLHLRM